MRSYGVRHEDTIDVSHVYVSVHQVQPANIVRFWCICLYYVCHEDTLYVSHVYVSCL